MFCTLCALLGERQSALTNALARQLCQEAGGFDTGQTPMSPPAALQDQEQVTRSLQGPLRALGGTRCSRPKPHPEHQHNTTLRSEGINPTCPAGLGPQVLHNLARGKRLHTGAVEVSLGVRLGRGCLHPCLEKRGCWSLCFKQHGKD